MKKLLLSALLVLGPLYASAATVTFSVDTVYSSDCTPSSDDTLYIFTPVPFGSESTATLLPEQSCGTPYTFGSVSAGSVIQVITGAPYGAVGVSGGEDIPTFMTTVGNFILGQGAICGNSPFVSCYTFNTQATTSQFALMINVAQAGYAATMGGSIGEDVSYAGNSFVLFFIGSALAVLFSLRYWIISLLIMYIVLRFSFWVFKSIRK